MDDDAARTLLLAERARARSRLAMVSDEVADIVAASSDDNADDEHDPEGATIAFERARASSLLERTRGHLAEIAAALQRLDAGTYGRCESCGEPVPDARLLARPTARAHVDCGVAGAPPRAH